MSKTRFPSGSSNKVDRGGLENPPSEVQVTVLVGPRQRALRERPANVGKSGTGAAMLALALIVVAIGALLTGALAADHPSAPIASPAQARERGPAGVAGAYGYPPRCLSVTISASDPSYARADFDHASPCGRYDGSSGAIFRRVHGAWRQLAIPPGYSCPVDSLPEAVQAELAVCPPTTPITPQRQPPSQRS